MYFKNVENFCDNGAVLQALLSLNIGRVSPSCSGKKQILSSIKKKKKTVTWICGTCNAIAFSNPKKKNLFVMVVDFLHPISFTT